MGTFLLQLLADKVGVPYDQILLVLTIGAGIPLGFINRYIHGSKARLWYGLISGIFLQYSLYGLGIIHALISTIGTYLFIQYFGRKRSSFWICGGTLIYLSCMHLYRMYYYFGLWTADDPTIIYMMLICKFSSVAFSYEDGAKDDSELKNSHWKYYKLKEKPTFIEILGYVFYYPSAVMGPSFEFRDFKDFINEEGCYKNIPKDLLNFYSAFYLGLTAIIMASYAYFGPRYPLDYVGTIEYGQHGILYRFFYLNFAMYVHRSKFYTGWLLTFSGVVISGLAYGEAPRDPKEPIVLNEISGPIERTFEKGIYGNIMDCEFGINPKTKITSWNNSVHVWLKYFLFLRLVNAENKFFKNNFTIASLITFMASAFWHGFYPTYYIFFFIFFVWANANEVFDKMGFYVKVRSMPFYWRIPVWIFSQYMVNALGAIIFNLKWNLFIQFMKNCHGVPILIVLFLLALSKTIKPKKKRIKKKVD